MSWPEAPTEHGIGDGLYGHSGLTPVTVEELRGVVRAAAAEDCAIYPQGGKTALDYGGTPGRPGMALGVSALDRVLDYPAADMTITVEAGITLAGLQRRLGEEGQWLTLEAPDPERATLGGIFATGTCGPRRLGQGRPRDQVIGVGFVASDGELVRGGGRVVKNVAGYDFPKLLTGSMGTLGVIVELTLRVRPRPESTALVVGYLDSLEQASDVLEVLNVSGTRPVAMELLNEPASDLMSEAGLEGGGSPWVLVLGYEDNKAAVEWQVDQAGRELSGMRLRALRDDEAGGLWSRLGEVLTHVPGRLGLKATMRPSAVAEFCAELDSERWVVQAHAGSGVVWGVLRPSADPELQGDMIPELDRLLSLAVERGGNLTLPRCPAPWKERLRVWGEPRGDWGVMTGVKRALDPKGLMNPGRFVGRI